MLNREIENNKVFKMPTVDTIVKKPKYEFEVSQNQCLGVEESPREWGAEGVMVLDHDRIELPWESPHFDKEDSEKNNKIVNSLREDKAFVILPVRMYEHSGIAISADLDYPFTCPWDSSLIGYIYAKLEKDQARDELIALLKDEVRTYSMFLNGEIYTFSFIDNENDKNSETIGGHYSDNLEEDTREFLKNEIGSKLTEDEINYLVKEALGGL